MSESTKRESLPFYIMSKFASSWAICDLPFQTERGAPSTPRSSSAIRTSWTSRPVKVSNLKLVTVLKPAPLKGRGHSRSRWSRRDRHHALLPRLLRPVARRQQQEGGEAAHLFSYFLVCGKVATLGVVLSKNFNSGADGTDKKTQNFTDIIYASSQCQM